MISLTIRVTLAAIVVAGMLTGMLRLGQGLKQMQHRTAIENATIACVSDPRCTTPSAAQ